MAFGMNTIQSPYSHGLAQKQITLVNQQHQGISPQPGTQNSQGNKGSHKEI